MGIPNKKMPTVMQQGHNFSKIPSVNIPRSIFDRSHGHKTTFDAGRIVPILVDDILPGDTIRCRATAMIRLATALRPFMDNLYVDTFFFFVPYRLVWANFKKFMGEQLNPTDSISFVVPIITSPAGGYAQGTNADYMGLPTVGQVTVGLTYTHSSLPFRALGRIYNDWFRDENLIDSVLGGLDVDDGPDTHGFALASTLPFKRGKRHDYFTSSLPFLQKGTPVSLPLGTTAPIVLSGVNDEGLLRLSTTGALSGAQTPLAADASSQLSTGAVKMFYDPNGTLIANLSGATAATINEIRQAFQIQKFLERGARGGTRYTEIVRSRFGVVSPDARLQRPEYLGGGSSPIVVTPLAQQSSTAIAGGGAGTPSTPLGTLAGVGAAVLNNHGFHHSFTEHGVLIGLVNVRADLTYQQGMERMWSRSTLYDFYSPEFAHLGEQAVLNKEIYLKGDANDALVFGYQERHAEYRYKPSRISGRFRSTDTTPLDMKHLSEKFTALPVLGQTFIEDQTSSILDRIVAVTTEPDLEADFWFDYKHARPMPVFGVPGFVDHF